MKTNSGKECKNNGKRAAGLWKNRLAAFWLGLAFACLPFTHFEAVADTWTRKADFGGTARHSAVGFSIGSKGYIGTGVNGPTRYKDFWEYDPAVDTWTQRADFGGGGTGRCRRLLYRD